MKRHGSIQWKYTILFAGVMAAIVVLFWCSFSFLLEPFYFKQQKKNMSEKRIQFESIWTDEDATDQEKIQDVIGIAEKNNMAFLIMGSNGTTAYSTRTETTRLVRHLREFLFADSSTESETLQIKEVERDSEHVVYRVYDNSTKSSYLECLGFLPENGEYQPYIISFPLVAMRENVNIASRFFFYIGIAGIFISAVVAFLVTKKIARPIMELSAISERMGDLDFETKYQGHDRNEIGILGNNMNRMSEKLEQAVSELKSANLELQKDIEKKDEIDRMRREFLSNVSHELKTPLALVQGYAEGLKDGIAEDEESRNEYCDVIIDEASRMSRMVKQLIMLDQMEEQEKMVELSRFNLTEMIQGMLKSSELLMKEAGAKVTFEPQQEIYAWGDTFRVEEVLTNYLSNARNHLDGEKRIRIEQECLEETHQVRITVHNTGKPIPQADLEHLWEKFYKVDKARTRAYGGSGIGLSIVKAIMESMKQQYGVYNEEDGVAFWFTLEKDEKSWKKC